MPRPPFLRFWLPPLLWTAVIFSASSDLFSAGHSGPWLADLIRLVVGHPLPANQFETLHWMIRKASHLTEYGILGGLLFRALRGGQGVRWKGTWAGAAIAIAAAVGALDEWHQAFVPSRTPSAWDVLIDTCGATLVLLLIRAKQVLFFRQ